MKVSDLMRYLDEVSPDAEVRIPNSGPILVGEIVQEFRPAETVQSYKVFYDIGDDQDVVVIK